MKIIVCLNNHIVDRLKFIQSLGLISIASHAMNLQEFINASSTLKNTEKMPVLFIGHGSPMNAIADNAFTQKLHKIGSELPIPQAIMVVSAHWLTRGTYISTVDFPETIYDFGGFPQALFEVKYPAPGAPLLAKEIAAQTKEFKIHEDNHMGLDHGSWTILKHLFPKANIPVFQLSINYSGSLEYHYNLANYLKYLRHKGILIISSGNVVHNLNRLNWAEKDPKPFDWAIEFDNYVKTNLDAANHDALINYNTNSAAKMAHPSNDHYLLLLYTIGLQNNGEVVKHLYEDIDMSSISMRTVLVN